MFCLRPKSIRRSDLYTLDDVAKEIAGGLAAIDGFRHIAISGEYRTTSAGLGEDIRDTSVFHIFSGFYRYVYEGVYDPSAKGEDTLDGVAFCLNARLNSELFCHDDDVLPVGLEHLVVSACARSKLDRALGYPTYDFEVIGGFIENADCDDLTLAELALLAQMDIQSVRNAAHSNDFPNARRDGRAGLLVNVADAEHWLKGRNGFVARKLPSTAVEHGFIEVPFAADGSFFNAGCRQRRGFSIGPKGAEQYVESLDEALLTLRKMPVAYWRRPNTNGRMGLVKAVEWKVIPASDFN